MFDQIGDMPLHPLVVHVPVIGIPLAMLLSLLFAFPRTRAWARWPLAVTVPGTTAAVWVAMQSGQALYAALGLTAGNPVGALIARHSQLAEQLFAIMVGFTVVALSNVFVVRAARTADGTVTAARPAAPVRVLLLAALVGIAAVALVWVVRVGDLGSRAVWNPTGTPLF